MAGIEAGLAEAAGLNICLTDLQDANAEVEDSWTTCWQAAGDKSNNCAEDANDLERRYVEDIK